MAEEPDEAADDEAMPESAPSELKFFADEEIGEPSPDDDDEMVTDEINLDELDQLLSEDADTMARPQPEEDFKTEELNLADLEKMLDTEAGASESEAGDEQPEPDSLDIGDALVDDMAGSAVEKEDSVIEELDIDLEDLENLLDEDTGLSDEIAAVEESTGGLDTAPDDLDFGDTEGGADEIKLDMAPELEDLLEDDGQAPDVEETEEIGISDLADEEQDGGDLAAKGTEDEADMGFELAPGLDGIFNDGDDQDVSIEETEDLDFSELGSVLAKAADEPVSEDLDAELELDFETPEAPEGQEWDLDGEAVSEETPAEEVLPELDLSELSQTLEDSGPQDADVVADGEETDLLLEMDDVDPPPSDTSPAATGDIPEETRELDVGELEALLEGSEDSPQVDVEDSSDNLELDIDLDGLDGGDEDEMDDATRELDLNDIEKILEMDGAGGEGDAESVEAPGDLDLDLDMDDVAPPVPDKEETGEETTGSDDALDLSELEKMLDVEDTTDASSTADEDIDDLDLDFDLQPVSDENDDLDLEFDMLDEEPSEASALFDTSESEDLGLGLADSGPDSVVDDLEGDLDFEIMDDDLAVEEVDLDIDSEEIGAETLSEPAAVGALGRAGDMSNRDLTQELMDEMAAADTQTMATPPVETKPIKPAAPMKRKKKTSKSLVLLLILALLGAAGYFLPQYTDIKLPAIKMPDLSGIPYIGQFFGSPAQEAIIPVEASLQGDWVENQQAGRLYTIQGRVTNGYASPRSYIRVTGRVYANGRQFQRAAKAYCGNLLTPEELATLPLADIQKRLSNRTGDNNSNVKVDPGKEVPFLVVFGELPPEVELQEFAVEISGSLPVATSK
ncbi:MAG: DUF3426 domain-containing protein [Desulfobacterales bacterium]